MARARSVVAELTPDSIGEYQEVEAVVQAEEAVAEPVTPLFTDSKAMIEVPLRMITVNAGYTSKHVDVQLTPLQAETLKAITRAAHDNHAKLLPSGRYPSGQHIDTPADAIRWLLEQVAGAA